jgi:hypothetical protein
MLPGSIRSKLEVRGMKTKSISTRRRFFLQASAALSVPLAASAAHAAKADHSRASARLAALEDEKAIRELQQAYARLVNSRAHEEARDLFENPSAARVDASVRSVSMDGFGEHDAIEVAPDRGSATGRTHCAVQTEAVIGPNCTLVEMAREQGEGVLRRLEKRILVGSYLKVAGTWKIERLVWERGV